MPYNMVLEGIYMLKLLPQSEALIIDTAVPSEAVDFIKSYIEKNVCENICVDISRMNILDACYVSTLCSTHHYIKYPQGKIEWRVSSDLVSEFSRDLELGNSSFIL